jgi:Domain of unknown function (DUF1996)
MRKTILLPASVGIALLLACAVALLAALAAAPAASAASSEHGASFAVRCNFSHRASDDPIVYPGKPGASHSHDFFGNKTTAYNSTYDGSEPDSVKMINQPTTCSRPEDTAGYWFPTLSWNGVVKDAYRVVFYYRAGGKDHTTVKPFAKNLRIIADKDVNGARVRWYCGGGGSNDEKAGSADPPTRCSSGVLGLRIIFPDCVAKDASGAQVIDIDDGDDDHNDGDHRLHMTRSKPQDNGFRGCPSNYDPVPTLTINANFNIPATSGKVTLSSDQPGDSPGSSIHTDFWNTWDQDAPWKPDATDGGFGGLKALVEHCINAVPPTEPRPVPCQAPTATA